MAASTTCSPVYEEAIADGCEVLLHSFRPKYVEHAFEVESTLQANKNETPQNCAKKVLGKLKASAAAFEKLNKLYDTMDRKHFDELVRAENAFVTTAVDREKGRKMLFLRNGHFCKGMWRYTAGTTRGDAFVAAFCFWHTAAIANIALDARGEEFQTIIVADNSELGCLDFNPQLQAQALQIVSPMLFPVPPLILVAGASAACRFFMKLGKACLPKDQTKNSVDMYHREDIEKYVAPKDTPSWWYRDDSQTLGVPHCPYDERTTWQYAATMRKGCYLSLAEIWNPGPWLDSCRSPKINTDIVEKSVLSTPRKEKTLFRAFSIENDPEDEW